jgi:hypothetical protein
MWRKRGLWFPLFFLPLASYQNILMNFTRYRLRHLSFCRCVSGNMSTPISSTENTLLSHPLCTHHHKQTAVHTNKHVKFVERQAQNCIFSFLARLRVRWARNKCDADRRLSQYLFALCAGQSYVCVYRGMRRRSDVFTIYLKRSIVTDCWICNGENLHFNFVARISTDNPLTESLMHFTALEGQYELTIPLTM